MTIRTEPLDVAHMDWARSLNNSAVPAVNNLDEHVFARLCSIAFSVRVAWVDNRLAGFMVGFGPDASYESDNYSWFASRSRRFFYVDRIVVAPAFRGRGTAKELYSDAEAQAQTAGFLSIACEVNIQPLNEVSLVSHRRLGFVPVGSGHKADGSKSVVYLCKAVNLLSG